MRSSPRRRRRTGGQSGSGSSHESSAGSQYRRNRLPIVVPGPTRASVSFSMWVSISPASCELLRGFYTTGEGKRGYQTVST